MSTFQSHFLPKGILVDLDGTLVDSKLNISNETKHILSKLQKYIPVSLCTGRLFAALYPSIMPLFPPERVHIVAGGGQLIQSNGNILWESAISSNRIKEITDQIDRLGAGYIFGQGETLYCNSIIIDRFRNHPWNFHVELPDAMQDWNSPLLSIVNLNALVISYIQSIQDLHVQKMVTSHGKSYFDITSLGVEKGSATERWGLFHKIDLSNITAIGDNFNDLGVLLKVGHKVVVHTAPQEVLKLAHEIIAPPDENGVAHYLQSIYDSII